MTEQVLGPFRLTVARSTGRDGDRFDAWDTRVNRAMDLVSLPRLSRRASDGALLYRGFFEEVEQQALLRHPNLRAAVEHSARDSMDAWYVLEPMQGASLRQLLDAMKRLPWLQGVCIMHELAVALAFAHGRGVVHAHLRPAQIMLQRRGRVILGGFDLGLKTFIRTNVAAFEGLTDVLEDEVYVAPETLRLSDPGPRSDLFSLGVVSFEMFTGRVPFDNADAIRHYARSRRSATPDPWDDASHLPEALRDLLMELIAPTMDGRPLSVAEVQVRLKEMLVAEGVEDIHASLRSSLSRQAAVFPRTDAEELDDRTALIPAAGGRRERLPTSKRGPVRRSTVPGLGSNDDPSASQRRKTVRERGSKKTTAKGVAPVPEAGPGGFSPSSPAADGLIPKPDSRRSTDRYESNSDDNVRRPVRRSIALQILADEGYLSTPDKRSRNVTRQLVIGGVLALAGLLLFYVLVLQSPSNTRVLSTEVTERAQTELGTPAEGPFAGEEFVGGAGGSFRQATGPERTERERTTSAKLAKVTHHIQRENYAAAERMAAEGLAESPASVELMKWRGVALFKLGRVEEGVEQLAAADAVGEAGAIDGRVTAAQLWEERGNLTQALGLLQQLAETSDDPRLDAGAGRILTKLKRFDDARATLRRAVLAGTAESATLALLADLELATGNKVAALRYYRLAVEADPTNRGAAQGLAKLGGEPVEVVGPDGGEKPAPETPVYTATDYEREGDAAFKRKSYKVAAALFTKALKSVDSPSPRLVKNLAVALQAAGQDADAMTAWAAVAKLTPGDADAHLQWGRLLLKSGRSVAAKKAFANAVQANPRAAEPQFELGRLALIDQRYADAVIRFSNVLKIRPADAAAMQNLGKALLESGEPGRAAVAFQQLGQLQPTQAAPLLTAATLFKMANRPADAVAALAEACRRGATEACAQP